MRGYACGAYCKSVRPRRCGERLTLISDRWRDIRLARYRELHSDRKDKTKRWTLAKSFYTLAIWLCPEIGNPFNQFTNVTPQMLYQMKNQMKDIIDLIVNMIRIGVE